MNAARFSNASASSANPNVGVDSLTLDQIEHFSLLVYEWPTTRPLAWAKKESPASCRALLSSAQRLSRVRRVGVRLAHYDIRALGNAQSIWVVNDHMDRAYPYTAAGGARTWWNASAIAGLFIEGDGADPR